MALNDIQRSVPDTHQIQQEQFNHGHLQNELNELRASKQDLELKLDQQDKFQHEQR